MVARQGEQRQPAEAHFTWAIHPGQSRTIPSHPPLTDTESPLEDVAVIHEALGLRAEVNGDLHGALEWRKTWLDQPQHVKGEFWVLAPQLARNALAVGVVP